MAGDVVSNFQESLVPLEKHIQADVFCVCFFVKEAVPHELLGFSCYPKYENPAVKLRPITRCFARLGLLIVIIPNQ